MSQTIFQAAAAETHADFKPIIDKTVAAFCRRHCVTDMEEAESEASIYFMKAFRRWYEGTSPYYDFATAVRQTVWHGLFDQHRTDTHFKHKRQPVIVHPDSQTGDAEDAAGCASLLADRPQFPAFEFLDSLSEDARVWAGLSLDTPAEIAAVAEAKGSTPRNFRSSIRDYLRGLGWTVARINESFAEVRAVLEAGDF